MGAFASSAALSALQIGMQLAQRKAAQDAAKADADSQKSQLRQTQAIQQMERQARLRRAIAAQRARFGAQGVGDGGSSDAVLSGLVDEAENEQKGYDRLTKLRLNHIDDQVDASRTQNLLQSSYSLARRGLSLGSSLRGVSLLDEQ